MKVAAIDAEARKLHADGRRRPAAAARRRRRYAFQEAAAKPGPPGHVLFALADFLRKQASGGELTRRLHPAGPTG